MTQDNLEKLTSDGNGHFVKSDGAKIPYHQCVPISITPIVLPSDHKNGISRTNSRIMQFIPPDANAYYLSPNYVQIEKDREIITERVYAVEFYKILNSQNNNHPISPETR